jgi:predicted metalloprotease with PDZ domain
MNSPHAVSTSAPTRPPTRSHASAVRYRIALKNPAAHLFEVTVTVADPDPTGQRFMLPVWIPGSYMIREFARNIVGLSASADGKPLAFSKIDKATWQIAPTSHTIELKYEVYAWDLSVRAAHLDETHGFFNGSSVFLMPLGRESARCELEILPPAGERFRNWRVATSLHRKASAEESASTSLSEASGPGPAPVLGPGGVSFGVFTAANYDELIDHPVEMGTFTHASFDACGVTHHIAITGRHRADMPRLCTDLKKICEAQIKLFEPQTAKAPMSEYWFLVMAVGDGYGGLEHRASTALICNRDDLPQLGEKKVVNGYRRFLGLASHEYFHTWNVKRIKPAAFVPYDLTQENYTRQLWFFEGFTSYYDDLMLARTGLIDPLSYLELIAENIGRVTSQSGRTKQSVADSSFDAWVKYYRQDENSPNAIVSYYQKGSIVGLALDLTIRQKTAGAKSLDDVMRALWEEFGKTGIGVPEGGLEEIAARVSGVDLAAFFAQAVHGTGDIDLVPLFESVAIDLQWKVPGQVRPEDPVPATLGAKIAADANGDARISQVFDGGAAQAAGLSAGDIVIAVDDLRVNGANLERRVRSYAVGSKLSFTIFRRDELMQFEVTLQALGAQICSLLMRDVPIDAKAKRNAWLLG